MDKKLQKACQGKMRSQGGMNLSEIIELARSMGLKATSSREEMLKQICAAPVKVQGQGQEPPAKRTAQKSTVQKSTAQKRPARAKYSAQWEAKKPKKAKDRTNLMEKCGEACFLHPAELKYPICASDLSCDIDCDGLTAARYIAAILRHSKKIKPEARKVAERVFDKANALMKSVCHPPAQVIQLD